MPPDRDAALDEVAYGLPLDPEAPGKLVEATVQVRDALVATNPSEPGVAVGGACRLASHLLALHLRAAGCDAMCLPATRWGDGHFVVRAGSWLLDPTAEQFGIGSPVVGRIDAFPTAFYDLEPRRDQDFEPSEIEVVCCLPSHTWHRDLVNDILSGAGLSYLAQAVEDAATTDIEELTEGERRSCVCFCGARAAGCRRRDVYVAWGCAAHLETAERAL